MEFEQPTKYKQWGLPVGTTAVFDGYVNVEEGDLQIIVTSHLQLFIGERVKVTIEVIPHSDEFEKETDRSV